MYQTDLVAYEWRYWSSIYSAHLPAECFEQHGSDIGDSSGRAAFAARAREGIAVVFAAVVRFTFFLRRSVMFERAACLDLHSSSVVTTHHRIEYRMYLTGCDGKEK